MKIRYFLAILVFMVLSLPTYADLSIPQGFTAILTSNGASSGTAPYTYQWFNQCPSCSGFNSIASAKNTTYYFNTNSMTALGTWKFSIQAKDSANAIANSISTNVIITNNLNNPSPTLLINPPQQGQPINILFIASLIIAIIFTVILIFTLPNDYKEISNRPFYLFLLAIGAWSITMPLLISQNYLTTSYPAYNIQSQNGINIAQIPKFNVTTYINKPFPISAFYSYLGLWSSIMLVLFIMLVFYLIYWLRERAKDAVENSDIGNTTRKPKR